MYTDLNEMHLLSILDNAPTWDDVEVEPAARELCDRLNIDFDGFEDYDTLFDEIIDSMN